MLKAVIYIRKSTDRDDKQALSLESQLDFCRSVAKSEKLEVIEVIEESKSAKAPWREKFTDMMARATKQQFDAIICWKMNRLARNPLDAGTITWCLQKGNIQKIITSDGTFTPDTNELLLSVQFGLSSQFIKDLRKDVKRGMQTAVEKWIVVQRQPVGYARDKNIGKVYPDKNAELIKTAFKMRADWSTLIDIQKYFEKNDLKVSLSVVERIIKNRFYYGFMQWGGQFFRWDYTAIIDKEAYDKANGVYRGQYEIRKDRFSLKGHVTDINWKPLKASLSKWKFIYYHRDKMWINEQAIIKKFEDTIIPQMKMKPETQEEFINAMLDEQKSIYMNNIQEIDIIEARKKGLQTRRDNLFDMRVSWEIDWELYKEKNAELHDKIMQCDIEIRKISEMDEDIREKCLLFVGLVVDLYGTWKTLNEYQKGRVVKIYSVGLVVDEQKEVYIALSDPFDEVVHWNIPSWCPEQESDLYRLVRSEMFFH